MPGTTYPSNVYPGQQGQAPALSGYNYGSISALVRRPSEHTANRPLAPNSNHNTRRLTPHDSNMNHSAYHERGSYSLPVYLQSHSGNNPPSASHPHPQQLAYYGQHQLFNGGGAGMFSYHAVPPQSLASWNSNVPTIQPLSGINTPNMNFPPPPPLQSAQRVWILDCKNCGTFLSNRGMKAVLLLSPNVSLFSTDALPINCSAYCSNPDVLRSAPIPSPSSPSPPLERTCECLTQTLCCHGCGCMVGYMIVNPCPRCITSTTHNNRPTNGHRFVFHSSEVVGSVRHYVPGEPGVILFDGPTTPISPPPPLSSPIPLSSPTFRTESPSMHELWGPNSASSSGSGLFSGDGEGEVELRRDRWRGMDGSRFVISRGLPHPRPQAVNDTGSDVSLPPLAIPSHPTSSPPIAPPGLVDTSPPISFADDDDTEEVEADDGEREEPPSLISSEEEIIGYQYPFHGDTIPNSVQSRSPPLPALTSPLTPPHSMMPMTIPVLSSVYPHPAQHTFHSHSHPFYSLTTTSLPLPAGPSPSPSSSSPSGSSPSPTFSHTQDKEDLRKLRKGDVLYWHHLKRNGEMPGVEEDERARVGNGASRSRGGGRGTGGKETQEEEEGEYLGTVVGGR